MQVESLILKAFLWLQTFFVSLIYSTTFESSKKQAQRPFVSKLRLLLSFLRLTKTSELLLLIICVLIADWSLFCWFNTRVFNQQAPNMLWSLIEFPLVPCFRTIHENRDTSNLLTTMTAAGLFHWKIDRRVKWRQILRHITHASEMVSVCQNHLSKYFVTPVSTLSLKIRTVYSIQGFNWKFWCPEVLLSHNNSCLKSTSKTKGQKRRFKADFTLTFSTTKSVQEIKVFKLFRLFHDINSE